MAIDVWLPQDLSAGTKIPTLMRTTPYYRAMELVVDTLRSKDTEILGSLTRR
ncbi:hypothetical protein [Scytonema sp. PRP1]|uniref:hypothetical protein n=1 Tax=Scytonema sp. PRP1 TaxID=3120513 RepID=UPI002FCF2CEF